MSIVTSYIKTHGLKNLLDTYHIRTCYHPELPLVILNYDTIFSPMDNELASICRGLILELDTWNIISQGMTRFFDMNPKTDLKSGTMETKEDGTLIHMFNYNDRWLISTKNNFANDYVSSDKKMTYNQLFNKISDVQSISKLLNPTFTYCLEMCSGYNRIVRDYPNPTIYLLAVYENGIEVDADKISLEIGWSRPIKININSLDECAVILDKHCLEDPLFEGFVIRDSNRNRFKLKNKLYPLINKLKYRGWKLAVPSIIGPLLIHHELILDMLTQTRSPFDMIEYHKRFDYCKHNIVWTKLDPFIDHLHGKKYCLGHVNYTDDGLAKNPPWLDGLNWNVECYCGSQMNIIRLKTDHLIYKTCPVHQTNFDILSYPVGRLIWMCSNCSLIHESYQSDDREGHPIGIPCSALCHNLRLAIRQLVNDIRLKTKCTRVASYDYIGQQTNIALFDIDTSYATIDLLRKIVAK